MASLKQIASPVAKLGAVSVLTFLAMEATLRLYNWLQPVYFLPNAHYRRFAGLPHAPDYDGFRLNSRGYRDVEFQVRKGPGVYRIVAIGDSFVFGVVPYRHNFLTILEEELNRGGRRYEVLNMGIVGTGPEDYLRLLRDEALQLDPDLVLCFVYLENDFDEYYYEDGFRWFVPALFRYVATILPALDRGADVTVYRDGEPTYAAGPYWGGVRGSLWLFRRSDRGTLERIADWVAGPIAQMKEVCSSRGMRFLPVLIPLNMQVEGAVRRYVVPRENGGEFDWTQPNDVLARELTRRGVRYYDLLDDLRSRAAGTQVYKTRDYHWNIAGNRIVAGLLYDRVVSAP